MEGIRLATQEEVDKIKGESDLTPNSTVWVFPNKDKEPDYAVFRLAMEADPIKFAESTSDNRKLLFLWGLENMLRATGAVEYYFNILAGDERWRQVVENFGAAPQSRAPEIRYKKRLF